MLTDISNEPDDEESMVRFLVYANEYDIEGLVATTSTHLRTRTREDLSTDWREYYRATWTGISGDRHYKNGPFVDFDLVDNPWLEANVIKNHGPLGALYRKLEYIMEGDTPSFLGLIENGLGWSVSPAYGGWGGRYVFYQSNGETHPIWTDNLFNRDTVDVDGKPHTSNQATIWRWRKHYQHDFAARMDWCVAEEFEAANHNPIAVLNDDRSKAIVELTAKRGQTVSLSAVGSEDPDGNAITSTWMIYPEPGTFAGDVKLRQDEGTETKLTIPQSPKRSTIHVVLTVQDQGTPSLVSYRRAIVTIQP